ncbi:MAG: dUTP diphosphatase, partial [Spirochaetes bacterium]|nr:dUTP diphosphatase [Spirochaetota bacterium]
SGMALKYGLTVLNSPGTIDSDYRGEIKVLLINLGPEPVTIQPGDRIAQIVFTPTVQAEFVPVRELSPSGRGTGGFGSTG